MIKNWLCTVVIVTGMIFSTSAQSAVNDVYYCVTDLFGSFDNEQNAFSQYQRGDRFIFKQNSMYLEFDQPNNLALLPMYPYIEDKGVIVSTFPYSHRIWFDGKKFTYIVSQSFSHFLVFATCSTF